MTVTLVPVIVVVVLPGVVVTEYPVIVDPPLLTGADHATAALLSPGTTRTFVGALGVVRGVTAADAKDGLLVPAPFVEVTVNVYAVPLVRELTVVPVVTVVCFVAPPGDAVIV